jgi:hypothetical protein
MSYLKVAFIQSSNLVLLNIQILYYYTSKFIYLRKNLPKIKVGGYVIAAKQIGDVEKRSVGLVAEVSSTDLIVFFIGKRKTLTVNKDDVSFLNITKTGKPYKVKICNICHILKNDPKEFSINQTDAKGRKTTRPSCKICRVEIEGASLTPSESKRLNKEKPKYLFKCPICGKISIPGKTANLVKDHDHITGMGRSWICDSCNTGLGRFKDNVELIKNVIAYLESYV